MSRSPILRQLTEAQREAVTHVEGPLLVLAGPGSGKTRVVTHRIAYLLEQGVSARQIVALTFTNKAADEMRRRVAAMAPGQPVWISTFHRFCARLLRQYAPLVGLAENYSIYDADDSQGVVKQAIELAGLTERFHTPARIARGISAAKSYGLTAEEFAQEARDPLDVAVARVFPVYQQLLLRANAVDFDDLLTHVAHLLRENPELRAALDAQNRFLLVDEYQDTNVAQFEIVRGLSLDYPHVAVTGDPDQAIYGWRGANLSNILEFEQTYPTAHVVRLEQNFRSTQRIVRVASRVISFNQRRKAKTLYTDNAEGPLVRQIRYPTQREEAEDIAGQMAAEIRAGRRRPADFAVFYRTNALSRSLEQALRQHGLPYQIVRGLEFYQRREIKDLLAYLQLLNNPRHDAAVHRVINVPPRGIGARTLSQLEHFAAERGLPLLRAIQSPELDGRLGRRAVTALREFGALVARLEQRAGEPLEQILGEILSATRYLEYLGESDDDVGDVDREANVRELLSEAREFDESLPEGPWLEAFLERAALVSDTDDWDSSASRISLMTLHAAKGLEFPSVYLVGVEEGLLPHERSRHTDEGLEEERRLFFVGITRAQEFLQISHADRRLRGGSFQSTVTSSFLLELPPEELERIGYGGRLPPVGHPGEGAEAGDAEFADPEYADPEYVHEWREAPAAVESEPPPKGRGLPRPAVTMKTAAQLLRGESAATPARCSVEDFAQGMLVQHPEYGLGKIVALSGNGPKRKATVRFLQPPQAERKFCLAFSELVPVRSPG